VRTQSAPLPKPQVAKEIITEVNEDKPFEPAQWTMLLMFFRLGGAGRRQVHSAGGFKLA